MIGDRQYPVVRKLRSIDHDARMASTRSGVSRRDRLVKTTPDGAVGYRGPGRPVVLLLGTLTRKIRLARIQQRAYIEEDAVDVAVEGVVPILHARAIAIGGWRAVNLGAEDCRARTLSAVRQDIAEHHRSGAKRIELCL